MGSTLEHGIYLPSEGEKNCYQGLAGNWNKVDGALGDIAELRQLIENKFTKEIVTELPTEDINPYCIYMILKTVPETDNIYDEWVYINNSWEYLGNTKVDMTQYYTKQEVNQLPAVASGITGTKVGNYDTHIANGDIHVTASDKAKWTNSANTHVLRLALSALTPSTSNNSFSNLDDSTALKVGDKVMDTAGVLFEVTAIDTANSTFTIGTALIDLAQDSDVVHKSGNETVGGIKTFLDVPIPLKSSTAELGVTGGNTQVIFTDKNLLNLAGITFGNYGGSKLSYCRFNIYDKDSNNQEIENFIEFSYVNNNQVAYFRPNKSNFVTLGTVNNRWSKVYATEYYYGSNNVEFSTKFVTTDTNQTISGSKTFSDNLTIYNSDNTVTPKGLGIRNAQWVMGESGGTTVSNINFLDKNSSIPVSVIASKGIYGQSYLRFAVRTKDSQNTTYIEEIYYDIDTSGNVEFRSWHDNIISLGTSAYRWKDVQTYKVNNLEPSSLSLPSGNASNFIDISSYFSNTGSGDTNTYTAIANGWIYLRLGDISSCQATILDANNNRMWGQSSTGSVEQLTIPILKGQTLSTQWNTSSTVNVANARFIPCQGNV